MKWLKRESEEAKVASETHIKEVLSIAEDLRAKKAEQATTIEELKRLAGQTNSIVRVINFKSISYFAYSVPMKSWRVT